MAPGHDLLRFHKWQRNGADRITGRFLEWHAENAERPFFAFLNYFDAHGIYDPPAPFDRKWDPDGRVLRQLPNHPRSDAEIAMFVNAYDGCLSYIDEQLERLFTELERRGVLDRTWVIVTSDHGEQFGEHGLLNHANSLYRPLLHVPFVVLPPGGLEQARRVSDIVSLRDLPATILDVVGIGADAMPGCSLAPLWGGAPASSVNISPAIARVLHMPASTWPEHSHGDPRMAFPLQRGDMDCVFADGMQLIVNGDGVEELYDLREAPAEERDLIDSSAAEAAALRDKLRRATTSGVAPSKR